MGAVFGFAASVVGVVGHAKRVLVALLFHGGRASVSFRRFGCIERGHHIGRVAVLVGAVAVAAIHGCSRGMPAYPEPPQARSAVAVIASFAKTWQVVMDEFTGNSVSSNIKIRTVDRSSGLIVAEAVPPPVPMRAPKVAGERWRSIPDSLADCGTPPWARRSDGEGRLRPESAVYAERVKGDSATTTVHVTVEWTRWDSIDEQGSLEAGAPSRRTVCTSSGVWESQFERRVKANAERRAP
jgi:hypothetical protein